MGNWLYLHVLCLTCWTTMWDAAGWNPYHEFSDGFSLRPVDAGMLFQIGHDIPLFPVKMYAYCYHVVCSSSLYIRVTHYFVRWTSESPQAKHLCASHSFPLLLPAVTSSLSISSRYMSFGYRSSFQVPCCRLPVSAVRLLRNHELSPSLSAYYWK